MDSIDRWLKSLRLHKYTSLFKNLTYEQMLQIEEKYLIDLDITKGARNKILVSVKKLNLRPERLINMIDDIIHENISMKEALTVMKEMLITPIPPPVELLQEQQQQQSSSSVSSVISSESASSISEADSLLTSPDVHYHPLVPRTRNYSDPFDLTYLYVDTFERVAQRLVESSGLEDGACHGIMASIVDECLKHESFTKGQKARIASFKRYFSKEQRAKMAGFNKQSQQQQPSQQQQQQQHFIREQKAKMASYRQHPSQHQQQQQQLYPSRYYMQPKQHFPQLPNHHNHHQQQQRVAHGYNNHQGLNYQQPIDYHHNLCRKQYQSQLNHHPAPSLSTASLSTVGSASTSDEEGHQQLPPTRQQSTHQTYKEYSLLGPGITFELPCLRAHYESRNRSPLSFLPEQRQSPLSS